MHASSVAALQRRSKAELAAEVISLRKEVRRVKSSAARSRASQDGDGVARVLKDAVERMPNAFVIYDKKGHLVTCNKAFLKLYDYTKEQAAPGTHYEDLINLDIEKGTVAKELVRSADYFKLRKKSKRTHSNPTDFMFTDGRWIEVSNRKTASGGLISVQTDITERKHAEAELATAESQLRDAVQIANLGYWIWHEDEGGYCSKECAEIHGLTPEKYIARMYSTEADFERAHPDDREMMQEAYRSTLEEGRATIVEYRIVRPDGEIRHIREIGKQVIGDSGREVQSMGTILDITEQKRTEEALRDSENRLRTILETSPIGVAVSRPNGRLEFANSRLAEMVGRTGEDLIGKSARGFYARPKDRAELVKQLEMDGRVQDKEIELKRADKSKFWALISSQLFELDGYRGLVTWTYDITARKRVEREIAEKEARLREILESSPIGSTIVRPDGSFEFGNSRMLEMVGVTSEQFLKMKARELFVNPEDRDEINKRMLK